MFPFKDTANMYQSPIYKSFCAKVVANIEEVLHNVENLEHHKVNTFPQLTEENKRLGVTPSMHEKIQQSFI